jgi:flagellar basal-body rod modification protein FlgD
MSVVTSPQPVDNQKILQAYIDKNQPKDTGPKVTSDNGTTLTKLTDTFDTFLKVLTTQMQFQDPLQPQDSNEFTKQLVSFAGVEQQINSNKKLDQIIGLNKIGGLNALLGYVGKYVEVNSDKMVLQGGKAEMSYNLPTSANEVKVAVFNAQGTEVARLTGGNSVGTQRVTWDGKDTNGVGLPDGVYTMRVLAIDTKGQALEARDIRSVARVTGVENSTAGSLLNIGTQSVLEGDVLAVRENRNL